MLVKFATGDEYSIKKLGKPLRKIKDVYLGEDGTLYFIKEGKEPVEVAVKFETQGDSIDILDKLRFNLIKEIGNGNWGLSEITTFDVFKCV